MSESAFRSPFAALVWKEWRESWWLLTLMVIGPTAVYAACVLLQQSRHISGETMLGVPAFVSWAITLSLGAGLFASDRANGTSAFKLEQPVTRGTVWDASLNAPILALAAGEGLFVLAITCLWPPEMWGWPERTIVPLLILTFGLLCFASAVLCSVLLPRPVTAWAGGGVLCFILVLAQFSLLQLACYLILKYEFKLGDSALSNTLTILFLLLLDLEAIGLLWLSRVAYVRWARD